jgi:hypothetical protein
VELNFTRKYQEVFFILKYIIILAYNNAILYNSIIRNTYLHMLGDYLVKLYGKVIKDGKLIRETWAEPQNPSGDFRDQLEECLIAVCKNLDIEVPLWLKKNTTDFGLYKKTSFNSDHFGESIKFDRLEIELY